MKSRGYFVADLPARVQRVLFGDRAKYGRLFNETDPDWREWKRVQLEFYEDSQKKGLGSLVNNAGYRILRRIVLERKDVCAIGPGHICHINDWLGKPAAYTIVDVRTEFLQEAKSKLNRLEVPNTSKLISGANPFPLPFPDQTFDVVIAFYCFEHTAPIEGYSAEIHRILKKNGAVVGAVPTEGGLAWGVGRYVTTRRWFKRYSKADYAKIICWEHPNFAVDVLTALDRRFRREELRLWPLKIPVLDLNLIASFIYRKT